MLRYTVGISWFAGSQRCDSTPVIFYPTDLNPHSCDLDARRPPRRLASTAVRALSIRVVIPTNCHTSRVYSTSHTDR